MAVARDNPQRELQQDENLYNFHANEENHFLRDSDPATGDEQPSNTTRRVTHPEPIEILSSTTDLSYEEDITATALTWNAYQINHGHSSPHPQAINYAISDQYAADINTTDQKYLTTAVQTISEAHHGNNISISVEQSVNNCLIYNTYSTTESREQRLPEELVTKVHDIIFYR